MPRSSTTRLQRWYPTSDQIKPEHLEQTLRQILKQHYDLQDRHEALLAQVAASAQTTQPAGSPANSPPGSGPIDTQICGLFVAPVDTRTLANGATLKWNRKAGNFQFS